MPRVYKPLSDETKLKISIALTGQAKTLETRANMFVAQRKRFKRNASHFKGVSRSPEVCKKISDTKQRQSAEKRAFEALNKIECSFTIAPEDEFEFDMDNYHWEE